MMKLLQLTVLLCFFSQTGAQWRVYRKKTDSSRLEIEYFSSRHSRTVREFVKGKNLVYFSFFDNRGMLRQKGSFDTLQQPVGLWTDFDDKGRPVKAVHMETNTWTMVNERLYPWMPLMEKMKQGSDSIITAEYGAAFMQNNVRWNWNTSGCRAPNGHAGNWADPTPERPRWFDFSYDVIVDSSHIYKNMLVLRLDSSGLFTGNDFQPVYGFEDRRLLFQTAFRLQLAAATDTAKALLGSDTAKGHRLWPLLYWDCYRSHNFYNGRFRFFLVLSIDTVAANGRSNGWALPIKRFDVFEFDPWSGRFLQRRWMKREPLSDRLYLVDRWVEED